MNKFRVSVVMVIVMGALLAMVSSASAATTCFIDDYGRIHCGPVVPGGPPLPGH
jgi:hypothetical protein